MAIYSQKTYCTIGKRKNFWKVDPKDHVFKIAKGADNFATPLNNGKVIDLKYWSNALSYKLISEMNSGDLSPNKFPISDYTMNSGKIVNGISGRGFSGPAVTMKILNPEEIKFSNGLFYWTKWFPNGNYLHKSTLEENLMKVALRLDQIA